MKLLYNDQRPVMAYFILPEITVFQKDFASI